MVKRTGNNNLDFLTSTHVDMIEFAIYLFALQENLNIEYEIVKRKEEEKGKK